MNFRNFVDMMRPYYFQIIFGPLSLLPKSFALIIFLQLVVQEKEDMKQNWGMNIVKIVDNVEVRVKYRFIFGLKKLLLLKFISQYTKRKTNKQTNRKKENKPMLGLT